MTQWKIREVGQQNFLPLTVNPSSYSRSKQVEVSYDQLLDGNSCRIVAPSAFKKDNFQLIWANVDQAQLDMLLSYINKKVEIVDHTLAMTQAYVDQIDKQYLISGTAEQRYAVNIKVREV